MEPLLVFDLPCTIVLVWLSDCLSSRVGHTQVVMFADWVSMARIVLLCE